MLPVPKAANLFCKYCHALMTALRASPYGGFFASNPRFFTLVLLVTELFLKKCNGKIPPGACEPKKTAPIM
jgi:hypothetical protein